MLLNFLRPQRSNFHNKLDCLSLEIPYSLVYRLLVMQESTIEEPFRCSTLG
jgi:hypothetical protein